MQATGQYFIIKYINLEFAKENFMKSSDRDDGWLTGRLYFNREDKRVNKWTLIFNFIFVIIIVILVSVN